MNFLFLWSIPLDNQKVVLTVSHRMDSSEVEDQYEWIGASLEGIC